ncbi:hypothetical protein SAMN02745119_02051 [Trichlorobacter thiogenes]|uniref:Cytochrome c domain-containing protein n=1 Tax=Trichlorobacter thiogenes TaxID=115783 RepID=A0A1T4PN96_9BACT|nr:selenite/tellurite reduction operon c-type cytochrome lipoprotein ExtS [Trichlorobacter thiogenes]SJZ93034.1 hypothetical protein SAMN02745119_02051 [Trichlorobacter thiogenes]
MPSPQHCHTQAGKAAKEPPQVVYFSDVGKSQENSFTKKCGGCHKLLSKREGDLGSGTARPNRSGLVARFYPRNVEGNKPWDEEHLKRWLKNPREVRPHAVMRPVMLTQQEWNKLWISFLTDMKPWTTLDLQ